MALRNSLVLLAGTLGMIATAHPASAQYYPSYSPYGPPPAYGYGPPRGYGPPPAVYQEDLLPPGAIMEDDDYGPPPGVPGRPGSARPGDPGYRAALPYPPEADPYPLAPPGAISRGAEATPPRAPFSIDPDPGYRAVAPTGPAEGALRPPGGVGSDPAVVGSVPGGAAVASLPPDVQPEAGQAKELPPHLRRQLVDYPTREPAGTIIIDTPNTYLYLVLGGGKALRYGIGVGREGFTWTGTERVARMAEWPDWYPPDEMIQRQPYLPRVMAGGPGNPLGARALYLGNTLYRIHGTNQPSTIGTFVSSGCIRLTNDDIADLYGRVKVGNRVVVLPGGKPPATASATSGRDVR
jgi:lipoprotein-anchoring transpeptidase ErfK/SrfK